MKKHLWAVILLLAAGPALAQQQDPTDAASEKRWAQSDLCIKQSVTKYPETDWASLHQRDLFVDDCLDKHHLPRREHLVPDTPPAGQPQ